MGGWMRASKNSFRGRIDPVAGRPSSPKVSTYLLMGVGGGLTVWSIDSFFDQKKGGWENTTELNCTCGVRFRGCERPATRFWLSAQSCSHCESVLLRGRLASGFS
jgi:hypothetical protein